ncbi:DUF6252 family protein [Winogradskyella sp. PG-2]|uniref:DUF6252 family protein n=1 Tax=Winogradskyella sp. PG-2 TaxID=754409 RepID=UPI0004587068|nr:DUF6252 family protein [Winogradskyella sp. PG-2]BAO74473.1 hypothetical protein WPG_0243 [Winogradskyella sp. PG-2]
MFISCENEPYEGPLDFNTQISCEEANENLTLAESNFDDVNAANYNLYCQEYRDALEDYISACPDDNSEISMLLDNLGDCELSSYFQVDFDGSTFFADSAEASIEQGQISIKGIRGTNEETVELIVNATSQGTYSLGVSANNNQLNIGLYSPDSNSLNAWQSVNPSNEAQGEITITKIDYFNSVISGTFNFTAYDEVNGTKEFSNGIFENILFTKANDFFAKVDGVEFVDVQIVPGINNFGWIGLLARDQQNEEIFISVRYNATPGTYSLSQDSSFTGFDYSPSFQDFHYGDGSVTVLIHNPETNFLMGTFSCTALPELDGVGTYEITEGRFCVTYLDGSFIED